jgi:diguanylate cyclase (GGDEF)-like protein
MRKARVLLVDDSRTLRRLVKLSLDESGEFEEVLEAEDGETALRLMEQGRADVVVCDVFMPRMGGVELLAKRKLSADLSAIPVIMLTGAADTERKVELLEQGASDYVTKPFDPRELLARVQVHLRVRLLQEELRKSNDRLRKISCTDPLLDIYNRRHLDGILAAEVSRAQRYGVLLSVVLVDVDHFKSVNDRHGHGAGDRVLRGLSQTLVSSVRTADVVTRYGGEEFAIVLAGTGIAGAYTLSERLRAAVEQLEVPVEDDVLRVTASFGVSEVHRPTDSPAELLQRADEALYTAKHRGRNRVCLWSPAIAAQSASD